MRSFTLILSLIILANDYFCFVHLGEEPSIIFISYNFPLITICYILNGLPTELLNMALYFRSTSSVLSLSALPLLVLFLYIFTPHEGWALAVFVYCCILSVWYLGTQIFAECSSKISEPNSTFYIQNKTMFPFSLLIPHWFILSGTHFNYLWVLLYFYASLFFF